MVDDFKDFDVNLSYVLLLDPIPEPFVDESAKQVTENVDDDKEQIDPSLPPELRKLMEQTKRREKEVAAAAAAAAAEAAAAEAQALKDAMMNGSGTEEFPDEIPDGKELTQLSLNRKKSIRDGKLYNNVINPKVSKEVYIYIRHSFRIQDQKCLLFVLRFPSFSNSQVLVFLSAIYSEKKGVSQNGTQ